MRIRWQAQLRSERHFLRFGDSKLTNTPVLSLQQQQKRTCCKYFWLSSCTLNKHRRIFRSSVSSISSPSMSKKSSSDLFSNSRLIRFSLQAAGDNQVMIPRSLANNRSKSHCLLGLWIEIDFPVVGVLGRNAGSYRHRFDRNLKLRPSCDRRVTLRCEPWRFRGWLIEPAWVRPK